MIFFFWKGGVNDRMFVPSLPRDLADLKSRIIAAVKNMDALMLTCVWQELEYRIDVCRGTSGTHIIHLQLSNKKLFQFFCGCEQFH
jgi:hypothetical protein